MISLIVAASTNNAIGMHNEMLWNLPDDMKFFKNTTWGLPVIMGRKTFEALGKALPGRQNIVITRNEDFVAAGVERVNNLDEAIKVAEEMKVNELMVIGGGQIYKEALLMAGRVYLTRVHAVLNGDTFFPELDPAEWKLVSRRDVSKDERHAYDFSFEVWER